MSTQTSPTELQQDARELIDKAIDEGKSFEEVRVLYQQLKLLHEQHADHLSAHNR